jgi:hypothetical protein
MGYRSKQPICCGNWRSTASRSRTVAVACGLELPAFAATTKEAPGVGNFARPVRKGHPIRIDMRYTADQLIRMEAYDGDSGQFLCELEIQHEGLLSADDKAKARQHLARLEVH